MKYELIECTTVDEFMDKLALKNWSNNEWTSDWVFRGEASANWNLLPTAWRADKSRFAGLYEDIENNTPHDVVDLKRDKDTYTVLGVKSEPHYHKYSNENFRKLYIQIRFERTLLNLFRYLLNQMGMPIPGGVEIGPNDLAYGFELNKKILPLLALAQHHSIPTRILDWSLNPKKALFFALKSDKDYGDQLAVWAWKQRTNDRLFSGLQMYDVQRSVVGYLHAQEGCFSYNHQGFMTFLHTGRWSNMEDEVALGELKKITVPRMHKAELLRLLFLEGISYHTIMPSYDSISKTMLTMMPDAKEALAGL